MSTAGESDRGFFAFFREYTHTGIHAASTAGLTAFGLLTFVHRAFVVLAIAVYVLPPIYLYLTRDDAVDTVESSESSDRPDRGSAAGSTETTGSAETAGSGESRRSADTSDSVGSAGASPTDDPAEPTEATDSGRAPASSGTVNTAASESTTDDRPRASPAGERNGTSGRTGELDARRSDDRNAETAPETDPETGETTAEGEGTEKPAAPASTDAGAGASVGPDERAETEDVEASTEEPATREWTEVDSPTDETLSDVVATGAGAYAVGTGGVVLAREEGWETVLDHGPSAESNALRGIDAADDGNAVWFAGDGGTLARYDAEAGRHTDHSAPVGITDNWADVAVAGPAGEEGVYLVNGSGQVLAGEFDGSEAEWEEPVKPGSGSSMSAIEFLEGVGYCCDTNSGVYETTDGREFERIGVENGGSFTALAAAGPEELAVAAADGTVQRYDGSVWTPLHAAEVALDALSTDGTTWFAVGDGGTIRELVDGSWEPRETPIEANLHGIAADEPSVAVGAEGTILELQPVDDGG